MKIYDLLWKKSETHGKARWEKVGALIEKDEKKSVKLDMMPVSKDWDGWLVVSERRAKEDSGKEPPFSSDLEPFIRIIGRACHYACNKKLSCVRLSPIIGVL